MNAAASIVSPAARTARDDGWRAHLSVLAAVAAALLLLFHADAMAIARIWWTSSTYEHCLFIPLIVGWLVWQRAPELRRLAPRAWPPGLGLVAAGGFGWLLGDAAGVGLARHAGLVLMLQGAIVACLGLTVARGLLFPLFYLVFLVPVGEELVPPLQTFTAHMCMGLLHLAGIPARMDGVFLTIPHATFEVAAACSGVKFLVAMVAYGALVANVCFRSWPRRIAFLAACVAAPVLANGVRAFGTIYVAHLTDTRFADGFDHVVYGWIFFALVMAALIGAAWPFFDRSPRDPWFDPARLQPRLLGRERSKLLAAVGLCAPLIACAPIGWGRAIAAKGVTPAPPLAMPVLPGWTRVRLTGVPWAPHFDGVDREVIGRYRDAAGHVVDLGIDVYASQREGRELVGYGQGAIDPASDWAWMEDSPDPAGGEAFRITAPSPRSPVVRDVATFYRVGDVTTGSSARVKIETLKARLFGGPQRGVAVIVSAETGGGGRGAVDRFLSALGPIDGLADRAAGLR